MEWFCQEEVTSADNLCTGSWSFGEVQCESECNPSTEVKVDSQISQNLKISAVIVEKFLTFEKLQA